MENRFGFKDLVYTVLLVAFIVSVWLAMKQMDRHGELLRQIVREQQEQTGDMSRLLSQIEQGLTVAPQSGEQQPDETSSSSGAGNPLGEGEWVGLNSDPHARLRAARQQSDFAEGDFLVIPFSVMPERLTPIVSSDAYASQIQSFVLESLAQRDPDTLEWSPLLARGWKIEQNLDEWRDYVEQRQAEPLTEDEIRDEPAFPEDEAEQAAYIEQRQAEGRRVEQIVMEEDAPAAATIRFQLRRGARFSDGEPVTAADVAFTFDWIMNPEIEAPRQRAYYQKIKRVEAVNDDEVAFVFREPYFEAFELAGGMQILPEHFYSEISPSEFNTQPGLLMGSGPYRLRNPETWRPEPGEPIQLVRNHRYWGVQPAFDRLVWRVIENDSARLTTFRNGDLDAFFAQPEQYEQLKQDESLMERVQSYAYRSPTAGYLYVGWNQKKDGEDTVFADKRVRQAMTMLTNRERVAEQIMLGYAHVVSGPFSPLTDQYNQDVEPWPYDVQRAKSLLAEAGLEDRTGDGVIDTPDGEPFRFSLYYPSQSDVLERVVMFLKDSYARAGVVLDPRPVEWSILIEQLKTKRQFDAVCLAWTGSIEGDPYQIFHSDQIPPPGDNSMSYSNPELDRLIEQARVTLIEDERMPLWHEVHEILHEDQPYTFLFTRESLAFFDGRLRNIQRVTVGLNDETEWFVPKDAQKWSQ